MSTFFHVKRSHAAFYRKRTEVEVSKNPRFIQAIGDGREITGIAMATFIADNQTTFLFLAETRGRELTRGRRKR